MNIKKIFQTALDFEEKGHRIYKETASKTKNLIVAKTFSYLAEQELNHISEIKEFIKKENPKVELKGDRLKDTKKFFLMTIKEFKEKIKLSNDDIKAHETALGLEQNAYDFYKEQHAKTSNKELKKFFKFLMGQENAHYELLQKAYNFIKDPAAFYAEEEEWVVEG